MIHVLAAFIHGTLTLGHLVGLIYNAMLGNYKRAALHGVGAGLSGYATYQHASEAQDAK